MLNFTHTLEVTITEEPEDGYQYEEVQYVLKVKLNVKYFCFILSRKDKSHNHQSCFPVLMSLLFKVKQF